MVPPRRGGFRGDRGGRWGRGGRRGQGQQLCRFFQQGTCQRGASCSYSHNSSKDSEDPGERPDETPQQQQAKADYISWKRLIKTPPQLNDNKTIERLWSSALTILNGDDRDWKQMLPRDLDDAVNTYGRSWA